MRMIFLVATLLLFATPAFAHSKATATDSRGRRCPDGGTIRGDPELRESDPADA